MNPSNLRTPQTSFVGVYQKDKEGNWKSSGSLMAGDLPKAILALQKAFEYVSLHETTPMVEELQ